MAWPIWTICYPERSYTRKKLNRLNDLNQIFKTDSKVIGFILNDSLVETASPPGMPLLDFIRNESGLKGTKTGCREGDCGACMVLCGTLKNGRPEYKTIVSCLTPLGNVSNRHIVTIEGLNCDRLTPVQESFVAHSATQCGFCTPGFILSLTGFLISGDFSDPGNIVASLDGNICRCTGYHSIIRAAESVFHLIPPEGRNHIPWLVSHHFLPEYFLSIPGKFSRLKKQNPAGSGKKPIMGGGTDLMVQKADILYDSHPEFVIDIPDMNTISIRGDRCFIGGGVTVAMLMENKDLQNFFPRWIDFFSLISSTPIRNIATIAGNLVNASPIADLAIVFLALEAMVVLEGENGTRRNIQLREFYTGYKRLAMKDDERIREITFQLPGKSDFFHFEKVSKRRNLDIASVNTTILIRVYQNKIEKIGLSAGGVAPIPLFLTHTCEFLTSKSLDEETLSGAMKIIQGEIAPISDIRGSGKYKRFLLKQLFIAHFRELLPGLLTESFIKKINGFDEKQ
jgi:xanthine dehydrogenase small subunit